MKRLIIACLLAVSTGPGLTLCAAEEPTVTDLKKELARTKAELAVLKAEADLAKKKQELQDLVGGKEPGSTDRGDKQKTEKETARQKKSGPVPITGDYLKQMPELAWASVAKTGEELFIIDDTPDFTGRFSFEFDQGGTPTPKTITGSGDFSGEISFNKHFLQGYSPNSLFSLGLGGSAGVSTDRAARQSHPRFFAGLIGKLSRVIELDKDGTNRLALMHVGVGWAQRDNVQFDPADSTKTSLLFDGEAPLYRRQRGIAAELDLFYPVGKASYVTVNARLYDKTDPTPWSLSVGYTDRPDRRAEGICAGLDCQRTREGQGKVFTSDLPARSGLRTARRLWPPAGQLPRPEKSSPT